MTNQVHPSEFEMAETGTMASKSLVSLQYNEEAKDVEDESKVRAALSFSSLLEVSEPEEGRWIREHIKCRECRWFVEDPEPNEEMEIIAYSKMAPKIDLTHQKSLEHRECGHAKLCKCGHLLQEHRYPEAALNHNNPDWKYRTHATTVPTNAYGEIEFVGHGDKVAKYVRVDADTDMKLMLQLMMDVWDLKRPNLLISVTGGAKNFVMRARLKDAFRRGLMKAALSTGAWIITGGTNAGVMKHVGEAVRDYGLTAEGQVVAIGIAPWGCVQDKHLLESDGGKIRGRWSAQYRIRQEVGRSQSFLDSNHSHFVLVDNGTQRKFATEIPFRAELEEKISLMHMSSRKDAVKVPVALLVVEGGPGTLETVKRAIDKNTPAIVIKGSGKCADLLAYAAQNAQMPAVFDDKLERDIRTMVEQTFGARNAATHLEWVKYCVSQPHLITVFELESRGTSSGDVDKAILRALLKANQDQIMDQLKLALAWNRIDVAKSEIFSDERPWPTGVLDDVMVTAIQLNRVDFVDLFLDNGVSLKDFLTVRRLLLLYNDIPKNSLLYTLLWKEKSAQRSKFSLEDVGNLLQSLLGDYYQPLYLTDERLRKLSVDAILSERRSDGMDRPMSSFSKADCGIKEAQLDGDSDFSRPAQELFIWAILMNRQEMAKLFWREGNESTAAALVGNSLLKALKQCTDDAELLQRLQRNADEFEDLAIGVLNKCYSVNEQRAQDLLIREMPNWGHATCVLIAVQADNKRFISQTACQSLLNSIWMGSLSQDNSLWRILLSMFVFPFIFWLIKFHEEERAHSEEFIPNSHEQKKKATEGQGPPVFKRQPTMADMKNSLQVNEERRSRRLPLWIKVKRFYTAPVVIFCFNCISYLVFLGLYSYILIVQLTPTFHFLEGILIVWVFTISVEEMRQLSTNYAHSLTSKMSTYFSDSWNLLDVVTIILFVVGIVLRFIPNDDCFDAARVILAINLISFFFRILHIFSVNKELGPKLVMIGRMVRDLMWFVVILLVFITAYSIASQAILFPNTELSWELLYQLPRKAYWQIYGELFLSDIEECTPNSSTASDSRCPSDIGRFFVPVLLGIYMLLTNVLLLNLLIAMFSYTFEKIQQNTDIHWKFQRFNLIQEYCFRPFLPPPLMIIHHVWLCLKFCCKRCSMAPESSDFRKRYENHNIEKQLIQWENIIADNYLTKLEAREADSIESRVKAVVERLELLNSKVEDLSENQHIAATSGPASTQMSGATPVPQQLINMPPQLNQCLSALEEHMTSTSQALTKIMKSVEAKSLSATTPLLGPERPKDIECLPNHPRALRLEPIIYSPTEKRLDKPKQTTVKQLSLSSGDAHFRLHVISRCAVYPGSFVERFPVPDDKVSWDVYFPQYDPVNYTADKVPQGAEWADSVDLLQRRPNERQGLISFNSFEEKANISRISFHGKYKVVDGVPLNPFGRTGVIGRGLFGRWGPNIAVTCLVTRWKRESEGRPVMFYGKPVLEFIAVKLNKMWAIPGCVMEDAQRPWDVLGKYLAFEILASIKDDPEVKTGISQKLTELSVNGDKLYKGYVDDARNTDNAWLETRLVNYHDTNGDLFSSLDLRIEAETEAVSWLTVSSDINLHGSHLHFLKLAAEKHKAMF